MKKKRQITYILIAVVILSNTPPFQFFIERTYCYQNKDSSFSYCEIPEKSMDADAGLIQFDGYKKQHPKNPNKTLYRTFKIKPWQFWEWWQYMAHPNRFSLPYIEPTR